MRVGRVTKDAGWKYREYKVGPGSMCWFGLTKTVSVVKRVKPQPAMSTSHRCSCSHPGYTASNPVTCYGSKSQHKMVQINSSPSAWLTAGHHSHLGSQAVGGRFSFSPLLPLHISKIITKNIFTNYFMMHLHRFWDFPYFFPNSCSGNVYPILLQKWSFS